VRFADISYFANRDVPSAIAVSAEAVDSARKQLALMNWFPSMKDGTGKEIFKHEYELLDENVALPLR